MAAALGAASGATFALRGAARPAAQVGAVTGIVGAAGGLGGFVPPLVMGSIFGHSGDYGTGLLALAAMAVLVLLLSASLRRPAPPRVPQARSRRERGSTVERRPSAGPPLCPGARR